MTNADSNADTPVQSSAISREGRMIQLGRGYRCPVALDDKGVIWIKRDGQWGAIDYPVKHTGGTK